jgi:REP element-mobilizing transposase RayT
LETLGEACAKTGWRIHAWVMMNNHCHLLLETPEANLVAGMKWPQGTLLLNKPSTRGALTPPGSRMQ